MSYRIQYRLNIEYKRIIQFKSEEAQKYQIKMGGEAFAHLKLKIGRIPDQQFHLLVQQITGLVSDLCQTIQVYRPLPEKLSHGDIDFMVVLKPSISPLQIPVMLKSSEYIYKESNESLNCEYKNKQIDFKLKKSTEQFEISYFYKAYSGIGAVLRTFVSPNLKMTENGLYILKDLSYTVVEHLLSNQPHKILSFYGLSYQVFMKGFTKKVDIYDYLTSSRLFDYEVFMENKSKDQAKMLALFKDHLFVHSQKFKHLKRETSSQELIAVALEYFQAAESFQVNIERIQNEHKLHRLVKQKFNGSDIIKYLKVDKKKVDELKLAFRNTFADQQEYNQFILNNSKQQICNEFQKRVM